jgi:hypothetical protein
VLDFPFLKAMSHVVLMPERVGDRVDIIALRWWNIQLFSGLTFSKESVELSYIACYEKIHPELKVRGNIFLVSQAYDVGLKGCTLIYLCIRVQSCTREKLF